MRKRLLTITLLFCGLAVCTRPIAAQQEFTFGIYEEVDCHSAGAHSMVFKDKDNGKTEKHCLASKPIVDQSHLRLADRHKNSEGHPVLRLFLTRQAGELMQKATQRLMEKNSSQSVHLGVVINGQLLALPILRGVIEDTLEVEGVSQEAMDEIIKFIGPPMYRHS